MSSHVADSGRSRIVLIASSLVDMSKSYHLIGSVQAINFVSLAQRRTCGAEALATLPRPLCWVFLFLE
jgi:hypothetical protein